MVKALIIFSLIILMSIISCIGGNEGNSDLGASKKWKFKCSRLMLEESINNIDSTYTSCTGANEDLAHWSSMGYDFIQPKVICLNENKIIVSLVKNSLKDTNETKPSFLAIRAIFDKEWIPIQNYPTEQVTKIEKEFHKEIIIKLSVYKHLQNSP